MSRVTLLRWVGVVLLICLPLTAQGQSMVFDGVVIDRPGKYDGMPAHLLVDGTHRMWWCSQGNAEEVWYATKNGSIGIGGWSAPIKVFGEQESPWTVRGICDPSVLKGSFSYAGTSYSYAMFYSSSGTEGGVGSNGSIGTAFSKLGTIWKAHSDPIIVPSTGQTTSYGAGMSGAAYRPGTSVIEHVYFDSTLEPMLRLTSGSGGVSFSPLPGEATQLDDAGRFQDGQGADIAFHPSDQRWYAVIKNTDAQFIYDGETRVLRAVLPNTLLGAWQVLYKINSSVTGKAQNNNPGLAKNADSTLYVDANGWSYVFFSYGSERPNVQDWAIAQVRFRPRSEGAGFYTVTPCRLYDSRTSTPLQSGVARALTASGQCGVPAGAAAIAANLTVVGATGEGEIRSYPNGQAPTNTSVVSFGAAQARASMAVLPLSEDVLGQLWIAADVGSGGSVHVVVDVSGYFF